MKDTGIPPGVAIRRLTAEEMEHRLGELAAILVDAVRHGASVNFMADHTELEARQFWGDQLPSIAAGRTQLFVADDGTALVGTVLLMFAPQPNQPHRADIGKMLVLSSERRQGVGRRLIAAAEAAARDAGRVLLMLDTSAGSAGEALYRRCGWTAYGTVPGHSYTPDGQLAPTTFFYKELAPAG